MELSISSLQISCSSSLNPRTFYEKIQIEHLLLTYVFLAILLKHNFPTFCFQSEHYVPMSHQNVIWYSEFYLLVVFLCGLCWLCLIEESRGCYKLFWVLRVLSNWCSISVTLTSGVNCQSRLFSFLIFIRSLPFLFWRVLKNLNCRTPTPTGHISGFVTFSYSLDLIVILKDNKRAPSYFVKRSQLNMFRNLSSKKYDNCKLVTCLANPYTTRWTSADNDSLLVLRLAVSRTILAFCLQFLRSFCV